MGHVRYIHREAIGEGEVSYAATGIRSGSGGGGRGASANVDAAIVGAPRRFRVVAPAVQIAIAGECDVRISNIEVRGGCGRDVLSLLEGHSRCPGGVGI